MNTAQPDQPAPCLDAQDLAAFVEGRLPQDRHQAAIRHLTACEECREAVADGALLAREITTEESGQEAPPAAPATFPTAVPARPERKSPGTLRWALGLAAAAALAVVVLLPQRGPTRTDDWVSWIEPGTAIELGDPEVSRTRGTALDQSSFLVGVHLVRLAAAERTGDPEQAAIAHRDLLQALIRDRSADELPKSVAEVEAYLASLDLDQPSLQFGQWSESGRLMALLGARDELRQHPRRRPRPAGLELVERPVAEIDRLSAGPLDEAALGELAANYGEINDLFSK